MVIEHLFPAFALIVLGAFLKRFHMTDRAFLARTDRLIYYIFFPGMLFWKIVTADRHLAGEAFDLYLATMCAIGAVYVLSTVYIVFWVPKFQAGAFSQSCYRFNTYVGMAVVLSILGERGVALFGFIRMNTASPPSF